MCIRCKKVGGFFFHYKTKDLYAHLFGTLEYSKKMQYVVMRYEIRNIHILHSKNTRQAKMKHFMLNKFSHGLRTPNEGITQRNLKIWADVADKICFGRT